MSDNIHHLHPIRKSFNEVYEYEYELYITNDYNIDFDLDRILHIEGEWSWMLKYRDNENITIKLINDICEFYWNNDKYLTDLWKENPHFIVNIEEETEDNINAKILMFSVNELKHDVELYNFVFHV